jgi:hypothetical protein
MTALIPDPPHGDPAWLKSDVGEEISPPHTGHAGERSAAELRGIVAQFQVDTCLRYKKRDLDGKPGDETCCNYFVREVLGALGLPMQRMRANQIYDYLLKGHVTGNGWDQVPQWVGRALANAGYPVVAAWENPQGPGHVGIVVPSRNELDKDTTFIAQAGAVNFSYGRVEQGFGPRPVAYFAHP